MGLSGSDDVTILVIATNLAPVVNAGSNQTITLPNAAALVGSASDDGLPTGSSLTHIWSKVSGPGTVIFGSTAALSTTATFSIAGSYVLRLTASDGALVSTSDITITVNAGAPVNLAPVVNAGPDQAITLPSLADLAATASDDGLPTGSSLGFQWSQVSGPGSVNFGSPTSKISTAAFSVPGSYGLRFTATEIDQFPGAVGVAAGVGSASAVGRSTKAATGTATGTSTATATSVAEEEFVGPFTSWMNVKAQFGAVGDGVADDTAELQAGLNALSASSPVLYLPAGTYRISATLTVTRKGYISIIGEDPATTSIAWYGGAAGTMLNLNGLIYSRFNRLTFNGRSVASIAVKQAWDSTSPWFDTGNEYADDVFVDVEYGIHGGSLGAGFAETSVLRAHFLRNTIAGISLWNQNALDLWVWNSRFTNCRTGVTNSTENGASGSGNFSVYSSIFTASTYADLHIQQPTLGTFNFRNNYSVGSAKFLFAGFNTNWAGVSMQGNIVLDPTYTYPVEMFNLGPLFLADNIFRSLSAAAGPEIYIDSLSSPASDILSIGNTFTVTSPLHSNGRLRTIDDVVVDRATVNPVPPTLPGTPANRNRQIFEVAAGSTAAAIQAVINAAAAQNGSRPVVHLPPSTLNVNAGLVMPANTDIQIVGDGGTSLLNWTGTGTGPVLLLAGPTKATLRDFTVNGNGVVNGIVVENADQATSRIFSEQLILNGNNQHLFVDSLDYASVQMQDLSCLYDGSTLSVKVVGGPSAAAGTWLGGKVNILSNLTVAITGAVFDISAGARVTVQDLWYEASNPSSFLNLTGNSVFSLGGSRVAVSTAMNVPNFSGIAAFVSLSTDNNLVISGNGTGGKVLAANFIGNDGDYFDTTASPAGTTLFLNNWRKDTTNVIADEGTYSEQFVRDTLAQLRATQPETILAAKAAGVTDLRMYRVTVTSTNIALHLRAN